MYNVSNLPDFTDLCFNIPLYRIFDLDEERDSDTLWQYFEFRGKYDGFCKECDDRTIYANRSSINSRHGIRADSFFVDRLFSVKFVCERNNWHFCEFYFLIYGRTLQKIGQYPSLADTAIAETARFRKVLSGEQSRELHSALGLAAHDVGIGAFVYLRRVFESLIEQRRQIAIQEGELTQEQFNGLRMGERVELLKNYLPNILVENKSIYTVLSKGIHELEEQECLQYFPVIKEMMLLILEEDLEKKRKDEHIRKTLEALAGIHEKIGRRDES